ncbi:MAG: hypothetical protein JXR37_07225 [Kiritimatiellae bacterium]|nr:hypothetical protein [Kiritimatiellia bacterium]
MHRTSKPTRKCYSCLLNLGDRCWMYDCPHDQWHDRRKCPGFGNREFYSQFRAWLETPRRKSGRERRREVFLSTRHTEEHYNSVLPGWAR